MTPSLSGILQQTSTDLDTIVKLAEIIGALATAGALIATLKTLQEMKRQTDLANNPNLRIRFRYLQELSPKHIPREGTVLSDELKSQPHETWLRCITRNLNQDLSSLTNNYLTLELSNVGKSEITQLKFKITLHINMFDTAGDILRYRIEPTSYDFIYDLQLDLSDRTIVYLPITNTRYFPVYECHLSNLEYYDVRGLNYTDFDGPSSIDERRNEILIPISESIDIEEEMPIDDELPFLDIIPPPELDDEYPF